MSNVQPTACECESDALKKLKSAEHKKKNSVFKLDYTTEELKIFKATFFCGELQKSYL